MKRWVPLLGVVLAILIATPWLWDALSLAITQSKFLRIVADTSAVVTAIEAFRAANGQYPRSFDVTRLRRLLEPTYIREAPLDGMSYYSDGESYAIVVQPFGGTGAVRLPCLEIRNGVIVAWPEWTRPHHLRALQQELGEAKQKGDLITPSRSAE